MMNEAEENVLAYIGSPIAPRVKMYSTNTLGTRTDWIVETSNDRLLRVYGFDYTRITRPVATGRFQARRANELWHYDI